MAETKKVAGAPAGVTPPHDRVVGLSLRSDGTPDQNNPELIGDKDAAMAATKKQFAEFAVSAADAEARRAAGIGTEAAPTADGSTGDTAIDQVKAEHEKVAAAAESAAEALVNQLHQGDTGTAAAPAGTSATTK
jgi:hypothetical protein